MAGEAPQLGLAWLLFAEDISHAADLGTDSAKLFFEAFVTAVHVVDAVQNALAIGDHCGEYQGCGGAEI